MKQTLILLAGYPGTGKSYLAELLMKQFTGFEILSPDEIKEEFWDAYGFRNEQEKEELIQKIESAREVLNKSIDEKKQYDEVYQNSILLDTLIEQYIEAGY